MTAAPVVSVIIAAYNGAALIGETLASLGRQTMADFEVIVVDDGSTDATREVVRGCGDARVRLIEAPVNGGPVAARNLGFPHARGRFIAGLDQDDLCHPERFARQLAWLDTHPEAVMCATAARVLEGDADRASDLPPVTTPGLIGWLLLLCNPLVWSSTMIRGDAARALDPFQRDDYIYAEDFDIYHRLRRQGAIGRVDAELTLYRAHDGGLSKTRTTKMAQSASGVLRWAYQDLLGEGAARAAELIVRHVMARDPVGDRATLAEVGETMIALQQAHFAAAGPTREDRRAIKWETARLWWRVCRRSVRSGALPLRDVIAVRPDHLGLGHAGLDDLLLSGLVGTVRRTRAV